MHHTTSRTNLESGGINFQEEEEEEEKKKDGEEEEGEEEEEEVVVAGPQNSLRSLRPRALQVFTVPAP